MAESRRIERIGYYGILAMISWVVSLALNSAVEDIDVPFVELLVGLFQDPVIAIAIWVLLALGIESFIID